MQSCFGSYLEKQMNAVIGIKTIGRDTVTFRNESSFLVCAIAFTSQLVQMRTRVHQWIAPWSAFCSSSQTCLGYCFRVPCYFTSNPSQVQYIMRSHVLGSQHRVTYCDLVEEYDSCTLDDNVYELLSELRSGSAACESDVVLRPTRNRANRLRAKAS